VTSSVHFLKPLLTMAPGPPDNLAPRPVILGITFGPLSSSRDAPLSEMHCLRLQRLCMPRISPSSSDSNQALATASAARQKHAVPFSVGGGLNCTGCRFHFAKLPQHSVSRVLGCPKCRRYVNSTGTEVCKTRLNRYGPEFLCACALLSCLTLS
jgi:hypothetical protein